MKDQDGYGTIISVALVATMPILVVSVMLFSYTNIQLNRIETKGFEIKSQLYQPHNQP
jgi:hypothetical protein